MRWGSRYVGCAVAFMLVIGACRAAPLVDGPTPAAITSGPPRSPAAASVRPAATPAATVAELPLSYWQVFNFAVGIGDLPEGAEVRLAPTEVRDAFTNQRIDPQSAFVRLAGGQAGFTLRRSNLIQFSDASERPCEPYLPPNCGQTIQIRADFLLRGIEQDGLHLAPPRWCAVLYLPGGIFATIRPHAEGCAGSFTPREDPPAPWPVLTYRGDSIANLVWTAERETVNRETHIYARLIAIEILVYARFDCLEAATAAWAPVWQAQAAGTPAPEASSPATTNTELLATLEEWATAIEQYGSPLVDETTKRVLAERYPALAENLGQARELVRILRDLATATSPETTAAAKAELLQKYSWELAKLILGKLGAPGWVISAIEVGWGIGSEIGEHVAGTCQSIILDRLRLLAIDGYQRLPDRSRPARYTHEGREFMVDAEGTFWVLIPGDSLNPFAPAEPAWIPLGS